MGKLASCEVMVYTLMDKLGPVQEMVAQSNDKWEEWKLQEFTDNSRKYVERNPMDEEDAKQDRRDGCNADNGKEKLLFGYGQQMDSTKCVHCGNEKHKSFNRTMVLQAADRREILRNSKLH